MTMKKIKKYNVNGMDPVTLRLKLSLTLIFNANFDIIKI